MISLLLKIVVAAIVGAGVYAACYLIGPLLAEAGVPILDTVGAWLTQFAVLFALAAAILYFAFGKAPTISVGP